MKKILVISAIAAIFASCSKDDDPIIIIPPSSGSSMTLEGTTTNAGANAENAVFVDFSTDKQTSVKRAGWDLGFYCGNDFKVIINNTNGASVKMLAKTDLNAVTEADFNIDDLTISLGSTDASDFAKIDDPREKNILNKTAISAISTTDADNKVYLISPAGGTHSSVITAESVYKIRVLRKSTGYSLQYAKLKDVTFKTLDVTKNTDYNFSYISFTEGKAVNVEPAKSDWDIQWTWGMYYDANAGYVYSYSDLVFINNIADVTAFERVYTSADAATTAYTNFNKDSVAKYDFENKRDVIGSNWRITTGANKGVKKDRFYVVKDGSGNVYKLKFTSFTEEEGGTRGKPQIAYELIK